VDSAESLSKQLGPILDTYLNQAVGVTGCHSYGIGRPTCELDVVVVSEDRATPYAAKIGGKYTDIYFMTEAEVMKPRDPETAVALAHLIPVRDSAWVISTGSSANKALLNETTEACAETRLAASLKALGRADEAYGKNSMQDADFWIATAGYDLALAWLYAEGSPPAPSHLLQQVKANSKGEGTRFEAWSRSVGLEQGTRAACERRLDSLSVLYDVIGVREGKGEEDSLKRGSAGIEIVSAKAHGLLGAMQPVDCFTYLGYDAVKTLGSVVTLFKEESAPPPDDPLFLSSLTKGKNKLLGESLVEAMGFGRPDKSVGKALAQLRGTISAFAKSI
jgi:hypothetical protein